MSDVFLGKRRSRSYLIEETTQSLHSGEFDDILKTLNVDVSDISGNQMKAIIYGFLHVVENTLESGDSACLGPGTVGTLEVISVSERKGRDISSNTVVKIPPRGRVRVRPTKKLKDKLLEFK